MSRVYDYKFILCERDGSFTVKGVIINGYESWSVLAGQDRICFIDSFNTLEEARAEYPEAELSNHWIAPRNYVGHLPEEPDWI